MEKKADDRGVVEQAPDLSDILGGTVLPETEPDEWQEEFGTGDPAFFIKPSDDK